MNPTILGVIGPGFLNQIPTLSSCQAAATIASSTAGTLALSLGVWLLALMLSCHHSRWWFTDTGRGCGARVQPQPWRRRPGNIGSPDLCPTCVVAGSDFLAKTGSI